MRRNGYSQEEGSGLDCHLRLENVSGAAVTGNTMIGWPHAKDAERKIPQSPQRGIILKGLTDSVVTDNSLFDAASHDLIDDQGGHTNTIIRDNPGRLWEPEARGGSPRAARRDEKGIGPALARWTSSISGG